MDHSDGDSFVFLAHDGASIRSFKSHLSDINDTDELFYKDTRRGSFETENLNSRRILI